MIWVHTLLNSLSFGMLLFLLSSGLTMIFGLMRIVNLAHGSYYLVGSYIGIQVFRSTGSFMLALLTAVAAVMLLGVVMERIFLRRYQDRELPQVLLTFGFLFIISDVTLWVWTGTPLFMDKPAALARSIPIGERDYPVYRIFLIAIGALLAGLLWFLQEKTTWGASVRASIDDEQMASAIGIRVPVLRVAIFGLGAGLAGLAGVVGGPLMGAYPGADLEVLLLSFVIVIIGGLGSLKGALVGSVLVGLIDTVTKSLAPELAMFSVFAPMALILAIRPQGLFGREMTATTAAVSANPTPPLFLPGSAAARSLGWAAAAVAAAVLLAWPFFVAPFYVTLLTTAVIWGIGAFGLNLLLGFGGLPSLGHAAFFGVGAYSTALLSIHYAAPLPLAVLAGSLAAAAVAALLGLIVLRARGAYFMLLTLSISLMLWAVAIKWRSLTGGDDGLVGIWRDDLLGIPLSGDTGFYYFVLAVLMVVALLSTWLMRSGFGYVVVGGRDNERRIAALGYNLRRYQYALWVLSAAITGIGGSLFVFQNGIVNPAAVSVGTSANMLIMTILGGAGSIWGPVGGAVIITFLQNVVGSLTERWVLVLGVIYIAVVLFVPNGLATLPQVLRRRRA